MSVESDENQARTLLCEQYLQLRQEYEEMGLSADFERIMDEVRSGGSALTALNRLGDEPRLTNDRADGSVGTSQNWTPVRLNSTFNCPHVTSSCSRTERRDDHGGWPMCYLDKDNPTGRRMRPKSSSADS